MHFRFIAKNVWQYMCKRKLNFILTVVISIVTMYLLEMVLTLAGESYYSIYAVSNTIVNTEYLNINVQMAPAEFKYCSKVEIFDKELQDAFPNRYGKFMFVDTNLQNQDTGMVDSVPVLYIDSSLEDLCTTPIYLEQNTTQGKNDGIKAYAGWSLSGQYPKGTVLKNTNIGSELEVIGILDKGQAWLPALLFHTNKAVVSLDECMVAEMDEGFFRVSPDFYANAFNSFYIKCETEKEAAAAKAKVKEIADRNGILYYMNTVEELISQERNENKELFRSIGNLTIFVVLIAVLAFATANLADVCSRHTEFGIMYINGVSSLDIFLMIWMENLVKFMAAFGISTSLYARELEKTGIYVLTNIVLPILVVALILFSVLLSYLLFCTIKRKNILSLLGGVRL